MRLWSLHPHYLDARGLVALWREGLLARKVLLGETKGYRNHPQLVRFRAQADPVAAIDAFLGAVCDEADRRGYCFDRGKISPSAKLPHLTVSEGQLRYEWQHLLGKLRLRDPQRLEELLRSELPGPHPIFRVVDGDVEPWEIVTPSR